MIKAGFSRVLTLAAAAALSGCMAGDCETVVLDTLASPDGAHDVRVWSRTCGAQSPPTFQFELVEAGAPQRDIARREQVFLVGRGVREDYGLSWRAPGALTVELRVGADQVLKQEPDLAVGDRTVVISYGVISYP
ncbi:hypothetical protein ACWCOP_13165 [Maricaulaceae bacterium MS644]